jgi:hypothetical protein
MIKCKNILALFLVACSFATANYIGYSNFSSVLYQEVPERDALNGTQNAIANFNSNKAGILQTTTNRTFVSFVNNQQVKAKKQLPAKPVFISLYPVLLYQTFYTRQETFDTCKFPIYIACRKLII